LIKFGNFLPKFQYHNLKKKKSLFGGFFFFLIVILKFWPKIPKFYQIWSSICTKKNKNFQFYLVLVEKKWQNWFAKKITRFCDSHLMVIKHWAHQHGMQPCSTYLVTPTGGIPSVNFQGIDVIMLSLLFLLT